VRSPIPAKDLLVDLALYTEPDQSALASRYEFDATATGQLAGLNQLALITFSLRSITEAHGSADIYVGGTELSGRVPPKVSPNKVFELPCPPRYGGCGGVYPLQVSLVDVLTGQPVTVDSFTTYLIVVPSKIAPQERLRFSFVVPVGAPVALAPAGRPTVSSETISRIETIAHAEASWPEAPLTVDVYGQSLLALARSPDHAKLVDTLASERGTIVDGPFSAVNPTRLIRAGLEDDLADQFDRGNKVFAKVLHVSASSRVYIATSPIGVHGLEALAADGISRIVVPESNLQSLPSAGPAAMQWPYTLSAPFRIQGSTVKGLQADPGLAAHLNGSGNSALRAQQLLADLAELYFDSPDYQQPRGVALVAPQSWAPDAGFLSAMLRGLASKSHRDDRADRPALPDGPTWTLPAATQRRHRLLGCRSLNPEPDAQCRRVNHFRAGASGTRSACGAFFDHRERHGDDQQPRRRNPVGRDRGNRSQYPPGVPVGTPRHDGQARLGAQLAAGPHRDCDLVIG
jgi:hypothetical protein